MNGRYIDYSNQNEKPELISLPISDNENWLDSRPKEPHLEFDLSKSFIDKEPDQFGNSDLPY